MSLRDTNPRCRSSLQNAEVTKQVSMARQAQADLEREKKELEDSFERVSDQAQRKVSGRRRTLEMGGR